MPARLHSETGRRRGTAVRPPPVRPEPLRALPPWTRARARGRCVRQGRAGAWPDRWTHYSGLLPRFPLRRPRSAGRENKRNSRCRRLRG